MSKKALITGIAGQDGSYLAELLLKKGYEVHGVERDASTEENLWRIRHIVGAVTLHVGDVSEYETVRRLVEGIKPDEVYHLATKHDLPNSRENYRAIEATNMDSTYFFLSAIKEFSPTTKLFFASSSKVFGAPPSSPQNEQTPLNPTSLYGISKAAAGALVKMYREREGVFACSGILFVHESPRRDPGFLTRKVTRGVARIKSGIEHELKLGDLTARRDWGFAGDYVAAMWLMLQHSIPEDYVIGTGTTHSVQELIEIAFGAAGLEWRKYVKVDQALVRPPEKVETRADSTRIRSELGWSPNVSFRELVELMVAADLSGAN